jgi:hypothetical protein
MNLKKAQNTWHPSKDFCFVRDTFKPLHPHFAFWPGACANALATALRLSPPATGCSASVGGVSYFAIPRRVL